MTDHFGDLNKKAPECIELPAENFDALQRRLSKPGRYDLRVARVLSTPAPWDSNDSASVDNDFDNARV
jgi:hypothetical protein